LKHRLVEYPAACKEKKKRCEKEKRILSHIKASGEVGKQDSKQPTTRTDNIPHNNPNKKGTIWGNKSKTTKNKNRPLSQKLSNT